MVWRLHAQHSGEVTTKTARDAASGLSCAKFRLNCRSRKTCSPLITALSIVARRSRVKAALVGAIAYFVLPVDAIPDVLPVIGFSDDAAVLATVIKLVASTIRLEHREAARAALDRL